MHVVTFLAISTVGRFPGVLLSCLFGGGLAERDWRMTVISGVAALGLLGLAYAFRKPIERFPQRHLVTRDEVELLGWPGGPRAKWETAHRTAGQLIKPLALPGLVVSTSA
jgi:hypothetical protein